MKKLIWLVVFLSFSAQAATPLPPKKTEIRDLVQNAESGDLVRMIHDLSSATYNFEYCKRSETADGKFECKLLLFDPVKQAEFPLFQKVFQKNLAYVLQPHLTFTGSARTAQTAFELLVLASNIVFANQANKLFRAEGGKMNGFSAIVGAFFAVVGTFQTGRELYRMWATNPEYQYLYDRFIEQSSMSNKPIVLHNEVWSIFKQSLHDTLHDMLDTQLFAQPL